MKSPIYHNKTRKAKSIPKKLLKEGKFYLIPIYYCMLLSELAAEGIKNSGSYKFADHIYKNQPKGKFIIGFILDAILLRFPSATSLRSRYLFAKEEIHKHIKATNKNNNKIKILAAPSGLSRELFEVADELKIKKHSLYTSIVWCHIDLDSSLIKYLEEKNKKSHKHEMEFIIGDLFHNSLKKKNQEYDMIICMGFTEFIDDQKVIEIFSTFKKMLKPNGKLVTSGMKAHRLSDYLLRNIGDLHTNYRSKETLEELARKSGFKQFNTYQDKNKLLTMLVASN